MEDKLTSRQAAQLQKYRDRVLDGGPRRQSLFRALVRVIGLLWLRVRVEGEAPQEAVVMVSNHSGALDVFAMERLQRWKKPRGIVMGNAGLFKQPWAAAILSSIGCFPVVRGGADKAALQTAEMALRNGASLTVFPEGTWFPDGKLRPFKQGAARIALQAEVPVLPVYLEGADHHWRALIPKRVKIRVLVGEPIQPEGDPEQLTEKMREAVLELQAKAAGPAESRG